MLAQENVALISGQTTPNTSHSYSTRIRSNSSIKPPARLRQSPETPLQPRKIRPNAPLLQKATVATPAATDKAPPLPAGTPDFPPPHVTLHPEDSSSKVFIAIGRSFLSVDNRAMTIKDLAEMTLKYGLMCQNVSAAGQAITTYIRNHMQRCEAEQDHPLLSRHVLSGTPSDDDLVPALHSRSGGAHCALTPGDTRTTNFRRGTLVWFLSKAAGAPCPFARAGIRLSEYTEDGKVGITASGPRDRKRERDRRRRAQTSAQLCGQKRKRLSRGCKADGAEAGAETEEEQDPDPRPPKVKLTLRLRPSLVHASSSSNSPSVTPSISASPAPTPVTVPTPPVSRETSESPDEDYIVSSSDESDDGDESEGDMSVDGDSESDSGSEASSDSGLYANHPDSAFFRMPSPSSFALRHSRSPSVASPPPDSDVDLAHVDDDDDMFNWSADEDEQAQPRETIDLTIVKEEVDEDAISSMLAAWDTRDLAESSAAVIQAVAAAAAKATEQEAAAAAFIPKTEEVYIKREEIDTWDFADFGAPAPAAASTSAAAEEEEAEQQEEWEESVVFSPVEELGNMRWGSASTSSWVPQNPADSGRRFSESFAIASSSAPAPLAKPRRMSELLWQDAEILGLETITAKELEEGDWTPTAAATGPSTWAGAGMGARRSAFAARQPIMPVHPTNVFPPTPTTATFGPPHTPLRPPAELGVPASAPSPSAISDVSQDEPGPRTPPPTAHAALPAVWSSSPADGSTPFNFGFGNTHFPSVGEPSSARASVPAKRRAASPIPPLAHDMDVDMGDHAVDDEVARSAELLKLVPPLPPPSVSPEDTDPLSPAEEAVFDQLCAVPDFFDAPAPSSSAPPPPSPRTTHEVDDAVVGELDENEHEEETADVGEVERPLALRRSRRVEAAKQEAEKKAKAKARKGRTAKRRG
ncbi:unnamed protein product [Peniophora sp. CBMAI 1063]|nr:unnamed protein product [Peniophora sp. CBMAI 1063]